MDEHDLLTLGTLVDLAKDLKVSMEELEELLWEIPLEFLLPEVREIIFDSMLESADMKVYFEWLYYNGVEMSAIKQTIHNIAKEKTE